MTPEVRDRIEQIRHENVPDGYTKVETAIIPNSWREVTLGDVINVFRGASPRPKGDPRYYGGSIPRLLIEDLTRDGKYAVPKVDFLTEEGAQKSRLLPKGSLVMSCSGTRVGIIGFLGVDACIHDGFFGFNGYKEIVPEYLYQYFQLFSQNLQSSATQGGVFNNLTTDIMKTMKCCFPPTDEQHKIVKILTTQDKVIELKEKLLTEKQRQKKYLMQQLLTGKKRLPGFDGEWLSVAIGRFIHELDERTTCNNQHEILSVTKNGIVRQYDHFNKQIASEDNTGYKILRRNNLAFSTMNLWMGSVDVLENYEIGIISPAYKVFSFDSKMMDTGFGKQFMRSEFMIWLYKSNSEQGASVVRRNLDLKALLSAKVKIPALKEQLAIATVLRAADKEIDLLRQDIEQEKQKKKALMQLLLTGIVRV